MKDFCTHSYIALDSITQHAQAILKSPLGTKFPIEIANKSDVWESIPPLDSRRARFHVDILNNQLRTEFPIQTTYKSDFGECIPAFDSTTRHARLSTEILKNQPATEFRKFGQKYTHKSPINLTYENVFQRVTPLPDTRASTHTFSKIIWLPEFWLVHGYLCQLPTNLTYDNVSQRSTRLRDTRASEQRSLTGLKCACACPSRGARWLPCCTSHAQKVLTCRVSLVVYVCMYMRIYMYIYVNIQVYMNM